jgi:Mg2+-importing ATPase
MLVFGLISSVFDLLTFAVLLLVFDATEAVFQTSWFMISLLTELAVVLVLRTRKPVFRSRPGRLLLWSTLGITAVTLAIPFLGPPSAVFGFVPPGTPLIGTVIIIVTAYIVATEVAKRRFFRSVAAVELSGQARTPPLP